MTESEASLEAPPDESAPGDRHLLAEIASLDEELASAVGDRLDRLEDLEAEIESLEDERSTVEERLERTRADFKNYKERAKRRQEEIRERATEELIERLLEVRDNLGRALADDSEDIDSLREGIELTRKQFDRVFDEENVDRIEPEPGTAVDANRHEVMMRIDGDQPANTIESVYRPGYEMAGKILRAAQVTVSDKTSEDTMNSADASEDSNDADTASKES